jgi:Ca2+-binding RTX toxin-like protein
VSSAVHNADGGGQEVGYNADGAVAYTHEWNGTPSTPIKPWSTTTIAPDGTTTTTRYRADGSIEHVDISRPDGSSKALDYYAKQENYPNGPQASLSAIDFTDTFAGSTFSDPEHRDSETPNLDGGFSFTAKPASHVARYGASGVMVEQTLTYADGTVDHMQYGIDGKLQSETLADPDGVTQAIAYHASGKMAYSQQSKPDGTSSLNRFWPDGQLAYVDERDATGHRVASYRANGSLIASHWSDRPDGKVIDENVAPSGAWVRDTWLADGSHVRVSDDHNGNERTTSFDAAGLKYREDWKRPDGTSGYDDFHADGSSSGVTISAQLRCNYTDDGHGNRTEILFDRISDTRLGERWQHADGSSGTMWEHGGGVRSGDMTLLNGNGYTWLDDGAGDIRYDYRFAASGRLSIPLTLGEGRSLMLGGVDAGSLTATAIAGADGKPALLLILGGGRELVLEDGLIRADDHFVLANGRRLDMAGLMAQANVLPATIETGEGRLVFGASAGAVLSGGDAAATVVGWGWGQTLEAGTGVSRLIDGTGSATFVVHHADDEVVELAPGTGTIRSSVSYSLAEHAPDVANLTLTGGAGLTAVGNDCDNVLTASDAGSVLDGGGGRDTLVGGAGADVYLFGLGSGEDTVLDNWHSGDTVRLRAGLSVSHLQAMRDGGDLLLRIVGDNADRLRLKNYFAEGAIPLMIGDESGATCTPISLLAASDAPALAVTSLELQFAANIRQSLVTLLQNNTYQGYVLQADGSYLSRTVFLADQLRGLSASGSGYSVSHVVSYLDGRPSVQYASQESWIPYDYYGKFLFGGYDPRDLLSNSSVSIETTQRVANEAHVAALAPVLHNDRYELKWVRVDWNGSVSRRSASQVVPVTNDTGEIIGFDSQTISAAANSWAWEYRGTARGDLLDAPGNLRTSGPRPEAAPVAFAHHEETDTIETLYVGEGEHEVTANRWTIVNAGSGQAHVTNAGFVYAGTGNHVIENAGVAYGGSGSTRFVGGDEIHGGGGDDVVVGARSVYLSSGQDRIYTAANSVIHAGLADAGQTLVAGAGMAPEQALDRFYQQQGIFNWRFRYDHGGEKSYLLSSPDFGSGIFSTAEEALAELKRHGAGTMTLDQALNRHYLIVEQVTPLPVLASVTGFDVAPSEVYRSTNVPTVHLAANDFATLAQYRLDATMDAVQFDVGISPADLHLSWKNVSASMSGEGRESLHAALAIFWGSGGVLEIVIPHADDPIGSGVGNFRFADGTSLTIRDLIAMAPATPDFDPQVFKFGGASASGSILASAYDGLQLTGNESDYVFGREGDDLRVRSVASVQDLLVSGWFGESSVARQVHLDGGRIWGGLVVHLGSDGNDIVGGSAAAEFVDVKAGDDQVFAGAGNDFVVGGDGNDFLAGGDGHDVLAGGAGFDQMFGDAGNDLLLAGPDGGFLQGGHGDDTYLFMRGDGVVTIDQRISLDDDRHAGSSDVDVVRFGAGISAADLRLAYAPQSATLTISIGDGGDVMSIIGWRVSWSADYARQIARFEFADGTVWTDASIPMPAIEGGEGDDQLVGTIGNDTFFGQGGNDALVGLNGDDHMSGGSGSDTLFAHGGNDTMSGDSGNDSLYGGDGDDTMEGGEGSDFLMGEAGSDRLSGGVGDDYLYGFEDNDSLDGGDGDDYLDGGSGNDAMYGRRGYDRLYGGGGDDVLSAGADGGELQGGAGNDTYLIERGSGIVSIRQGLGMPVFDESGSLIADPSEMDAAASDIDVVRFGAGIAPDDVLLSYDASTGSLRIALRGSDDVVRIVDWAQDTSRSIARYEFADGTVWTEGTMPLLAFHGTDGGDWLIGSAGRDAMSGANGNDYLFGRAGADVMFGDAGDDYLDGGSGDDNLSGGTGFDWLYGGEGNDILASGPDGGGMIGGAGDDAYCVERGDGVVRIDQRIASDASDPTATQYARPEDVDVIRFGTGILPGDIRAAYDRSNATLTLSLGGEDSVVVTGWHVQPDVAAARDIARFEFADGTIWSPAEIDALTQNHAPVPTVALMVQQAVEGVLYHFDVPMDVFVDEDVGDVLSLSASRADGSPLPSWLRFDPGTGVLSGVPEFHDTGTIDIALTATDLSGASASQTFSLAIEAVTGVTLIGTVGNDTLTGTHRNDTLDGGAGRDRMVGGAGNDTYYVDNSGDTVVELAGEGTDTVISTVSLTLAANVENLNLAGSANISCTGNALDNVLNGNAANNTLNGGLGVDAMIGGVGNDTYYVDNPGDVVVEFANEGTDRVVSSVSYTLSDKVENLTLFGSDAINGTGNELNNTIVGNAGSNTLSGLGGNDSLIGGDANDTLLGGTGTDTLNGGLGADVMEGGVDNDTYYVDNLGDVVSEFANEGTDRVISTISYTLGDNVENLTLTGSETINGTGNELNNAVVGNTAENVLAGLGGNDSLTGGDSNDTLLGGTGNDTLNGGLGADNMVGGADNDTYYVDNLGDVVSEFANEGTDRIISTISYTLGDNVENLTLLGAEAINGTGNALDNTLVGNAGANRLYGLGGNDRLTGNASDDLLDGGDGNDILTAGDGNDILMGGVGNDTLNGGAGDDSMTGDAGNDTYYVDSAGDSVTELADEGTDRVISTISYTLGDNLENLTLSGTEAINGIGNALANSLAGNAAANLLNGGEGNDTLNGAAGIDFLEGMAGNDTLSDTAGSGYFNGGAGADRLTGGASADFFLGDVGNDTITSGDGDDIIVFNKGDGQDTFAAGGAGSDTLSLGGGIDYADLAFRKSSNDLVLKVGSADQITFKNWYATTPSKPVLNLQVIAEAMADFAAGGADPLRDQKVENFNFAGLAGAFDAARTANPGLTTWALTNALASFQLAGSDSAALGGDLAYQYGKNGTLTGIGLNAAQQVIGDTNFGNSAQTLRPLSGLQEGAVRLS